MQLDNYRIYQVATGQLLSPFMSKHEAEQVRRGFRATTAGTSNHEFPPSWPGSSGRERK
jgi:hypothetical protein